MAALDDEEQALRSVALQNATSILLARERAEEELVRTKEVLRESEERLRAIFSHAAVGIAVAALDGFFLDMNRKFCEILGYRADELRRLTFTQISHPDDLPDTLAKVHQLLAGSISEYTLEKRYLRQDGSFVWSHTTVTLLKDAAGEARHFIGVIEDITRRKHAEESLQRANEERESLLVRERAARAEAERMSEIKDDFLATLSHELRTPLSAILGWAQVLRGRPNEDDYLKGIATIERNARLQAQLVDDLLDMSRITAGNLRLEIQPLQPVSFTEAAVETVRPTAVAKGIRLELLLDPTAGLIAGDPARLQQAVWNLLSNAIKFTPAGGTVQVRLARVNAHIEISVADTGVGVSAEFLPHLFERFRQGDASTTRKYGGLGIGLSIVKRLVELHGGLARATSPGEGRGTIVTLQLPLMPVPVGVEAGRRGPPQISHLGQRPLILEGLDGLNILVVDDQEDARDLIKLVLENSGATVVTAGTAAETLRLVERHRPDILISDVAMPDGDGCELLQRVRALGPDQGGTVPAIALTAFARPEDRTRALRAGFLVHVSKPVDASELVATVAGVAGRVDYRA